QQRLIDFDRLASEEQFHQFVVNAHGRLSCSCQMEQHVFGCTGISLTERLELTSIFINEKQLGSKTVESDCNRPTFAYRFHHDSRHKGRVVLSRRTCSSSALARPKQGLRARQRALTTASRSAQGALVKHNWSREAPPSPAPPSCVRTSPM